MTESSINRSPSPDFVKPKRSSDKRSSSPEGRRIEKNEELVFHQANKRHDKSTLQTLGLKTEVSTTAQLTEEEKNEEILGLLSCLNEQATKELNSM